MQRSISSFISMMINYVTQCFTIHARWLCSIFEDAYFFCLSTWMCKQWCTEHWNRPLPFIYIRFTNDQCNWWTWFPIILLKSSWFWVSLSKVVPSRKTTVRICFLSIDCVFELYMEHEKQKHSDMSFMLNCPILMWQKYCACPWKR